MDINLIYLAAVFGVIILLLNIKIKRNGETKRIALSVAMLGGILCAILLYKISFFDSLMLVKNTLLNWNETISLCLVTYLITFLQRGMEHKKHLHQAQVATTAIFNSRRVNAMFVPILVGMLPSPAAAFIAGDIVKDTCGDYLDNEECTFVTSYYRHISESCMPTYTSIILALTLGGVSISRFLIGMIIPVIVLILLGYLFYVHKVPKDTGLPKETKLKKRFFELIEALWSIAVIIILIIAFDIPVYIAIGSVTVLYFIINRFSFKEVLPYFKSAFEWNIMLNTVIVMLFKNILADTGVIHILTDTLQKLPLPLPMIFFAVFVVGSLVAGSNGIIAMCMPMAYAAIPDGGTALMVLLMCGTYIAMQISPVHICLTLISEYFHTSLGTLVKKTIPVLSVFVVFIIVYYYALTLIPSF